MGRGAWQASVHGVAESWMGLSDYHTHTQSQGCHSLPLSELGLCAKDTSPLLYIQYLFYLIQKDRRLCLMLPQEG